VFRNVVFCIFFLIEFELKNLFSVGRFPATIGEERTIAYLSNEFKNLGLTGPDPKEGFVQNVPLVKITPKKRTNLIIKHANASNEPLELQDSTEFTAVTSSAVPEAHLQDVELVFAGYGIKADPFGWNDFKKVLLILCVPIQALTKRRV